MGEDIGPAQYKAALRRFATGVTVISCVVEGQDHAMTASAFTAVSLEPPLVLVCVARNARFSAAIGASTQWGVSILGASAQSCADWLATSGRPLAGQLERVPHHRGSTGVALLDDSLATLECVTTSRTAAGDHDVVVGRVVAAAVTDLDDPLLHWMSAYHGIARD
jgi:flavin reductase (DIM6/NTAB) family NADH-FMN oxidoreductase RutF